jgi:predicted helicase
VRPNARGDWINQTVNDFDTFIPIADKETKSTKVSGQEHSIFKLFSLGVVTARDEWVYDHNDERLREKVRLLIRSYNADLQRLSLARKNDKLADMLDYSIKWTRAVKNDLRKARKYEFSDGEIRASLYRPFVRLPLYFSKRLNEMTYQIESIFPRKDTENIYIAIVAGNRLAFAALAGEAIPNYALYSLDPAQCLPRWRIDGASKADNITDWALEQFRSQYDKGTKINHLITKDAIFNYVYGVLHDPIYREKYALNLRREFPRVPFYADFWRWAAWGEALMKLHIAYEKVEPWPLERIDVPDEKARKAGLAPKAMLKADKEAGNIRLDSETQFTGVPPEAWAYKLGNRSALEWILDQYKEKTPKDPTIREKFNTYHFADHKEKVIDLLKRVTRVSVETMKIVEAMKAEKR